MSGRLGRRSIARIALAVLVATALFAGRMGVPGAEVSALSRWTGGVDLYRSGVFTTQKTWQWCTAADVQIIRNIVERATDHTKSGQRRYFDYMRAHNRYSIPVSDGVDPAGWTSGLRHFVDDRYRLVQSRSFDSALRSAVTNLRKTNLPVAITVSRGNHGWVMTGFTATADPAATTRFTVTSVRVVGSLWGLQSRRYGYDMRPDTKLTPRQLKGFFTPWHYAGVRMAWEGRWVSVQPVATATTSTSSSAAAPAADPGASGELTAGGNPAASPTSAATATMSGVSSASANPAAPPLPNLSPTATPGPTSTRSPAGSASATGGPSTPTPSGSPSNGLVAIAEPAADAGDAGGSTPASSSSPATRPVDAIPPVALAALLVVFVVIAVALGWQRRSRDTLRSR